MFETIIQARYGKDDKPLSVFKYTIDNELYVLANHVPNFLEYKTKLSQVLKSPTLLLKEFKIETKQVKAEELKKLKSLLPDKELDVATPVITIIQVKSAIILCRSVLLKSFNSIPFRKFLVDVLRYYDKNRKLAIEKKKLEEVSIAKLSIGSFRAKRKEVLNEYLALRSDIQTKEDLLKQYLNFDKSMTKQERDVLHTKLKKYF